jgi:hypothetical protein
MLKIQVIDGELFYFVYTNEDNTLILVTRSNHFAMITNAALKNIKHDADYRIKSYRERKKAA